MPGPKKLARAPLCLTREGPPVASETLWCSTRERERERERERRCLRDGDGGGGSGGGWKPLRKRPSGRKREGDAGT